MNAPVRQRQARTSRPIVTKRRCAIYTRKSSEEGLDMDFNSLDAQREACEAFVASQKAEGWVLVPDHYDDGGFSGGTLDRPALKRLLADIEAGLVDIVVVYKIDRLSRSLMDFARLVEIFDRNDVTFVSVTQSFNTTTSMGRLTLNILLSFAQFEREVTGERIRDKFAASRKKGMWMGGWAPYGYDIKDRKLVINKNEAEQVRQIFDRMAKGGSITAIVRDLAARGIVNKYGKRFDKGKLYKLVNNRVYIGDAVHKGTAYPGEHEAIITKALWDKVHAAMAVRARTRGNRTRAQTPALLKGLIFDSSGRAMSPTHTPRKQKLYRYYVSQSLIRDTGRETCNDDAEADPAIRRVPAGDVEAAVIDQLRVLLQSPEIIVATWRAAREHLSDLTEEDVRRAIGQFDDLWSELFPAEQARIVQLLVDRVDIQSDGLAIRLKVGGLGRLAAELLGPAGSQQTVNQKPKTNGAKASVRVGNAVS